MKIFFKFKHYLFMKKKLFNDKIIINFIYFMKKI